MKKLIFIVLAFIAFVYIARFSYLYLIGQEGFGYFSIMKGIVQLNTSEGKIVKVSDNPEEYIFNASNIKDIEQMVKGQGFEGEEYYKSVKHISQNEYIRTSMRMFSKNYIILTYTIVKRSN